jgi:arylformamidase
MTMPDQAQYRAELDFEITFASGGRLAGEGFRIDVAGPDLNDDELGAALIRDLGLLMADEVRISRRRIFPDRHKRAVPRGPATPSASAAALLLRTGWDARWGSAEYHSGFPFLTAAAARHLVDAGAVLVGIDAPNVDDTDDPERPAHAILLAAGVSICEHLTGLAALPGSGFKFSAVPPKVAAFGTFPVRAYATWSSPA